MKTVQQLGERALIRQLAACLPPRSDVRASIGHDVAVVTGDRTYDLLLKSDAVLEGRHFLRQTPPSQIGHKALGRVLSDLAAAGGEPLWALINLVASRTESIVRLSTVYRGIATLARRYRVAVVGGDTTEGSALELHVFAVGRVPCGTARLRSGAHPGDVIFVTSALGGSFRGKHLRFTPRLAEGRWLREGRWATAAIDLSDGLATDLAHILEMSDVGAEVQTEKIPVAAAVFQGLEKHKGGFSGNWKKWARSFPDLGKSSGKFSKAWKQRIALAHALCDGEDFELLFTVPRRKAAALARAWRRKFRTRLTSIGTITRQKQQLVWLADGQPLKFYGAGFEHFR